MSYTNDFNYCEYDDDEFEDDWDSEADWKI